LTSFLHRNSKSFFLAIFPLLLFCLTGAESLTGVGQWHSYTAKNNVRGVTVDRYGIMWAATGGGMYSFNPADSTYQLFTASEGLRINDLTAITVDTSGAIWTGASNGFLHAYNPRSGVWTYVSDISLLTPPDRRINALKVVGDTLFVLSDIGLSVYSISRNQFGDTYSRFGPDAAQISGDIYSVDLFDDSIWVATANGLAASDLTNSNLSAPESWTVFTSANGLPSSTVTGTAVAGGKLFVATSQGIVERTSGGSGWTPVLSTPGLQVLSLAAAPTSSPSIVFVTASQLWNIAPTSGTDAANLIATYNASPLTVVAGSSSINQSFVGTQAAGVIANRSGAWKSLLPPGPANNSFVGVAVDNNGHVWAGTGNNPGQGFQSFDGTTWKLYTAEQDPRLVNDAYFQASIGPNNSKWMSNWGQGVALYDASGNLKKVLNTTNGLLTALTDQQYVIIGGIATDQSGNVWMTNRTPPGDTALVVFHRDSSLSYVTGLSTRSPAIIMYQIVIDQNNTKWMANYGRFEQIVPTAVYFYNESQTIPGTTNGWGSLSTNDGLSSDIAYCVAVGQAGDVWLGSDQGITIIFNPGSPTSQIALYHPLNDQIVQAIYVDPLNNKWIATKQGVFELSSDGTVILQHYSVASTNGKLLDDDITSIGMDTKKGILYFGTQFGLSALTTDAITPVSAFGALKVYPDPFFLPATQPVTVTGLIANSSLKILSSSGALVKDIVTSGGSVGFWDGTDNAGATVASGVYFIVAYSSDGSSTATTKIAVLRK
jgi:ligand-binding sensor domain-containing protein